jgi:putative ABC transport system permease protein
MSKDFSPPRLPRRLIELFAGSADIEDLLGDVDELFYENRKTKSLVYAQLRYWKDVLSLCCSALRKRKANATFGEYSLSTFSLDMIRNYIKISVRNLYRYKYFSLINAFGLAIGMSVSLLLISLRMFVGTYDDFHQNGDRIFTITSTRAEGIDETKFWTAPMGLADKMQNELAVVKEVVRIVKAEDNMIKNGSGNVSVPSYFVEPQFLSVFSFPLIAGKASVLSDPNQVILTESAADKLFNTTDVIGKSVELANGTIAHVGGVLRNIANNSHMKFDMLISLNSLGANPGEQKDQWTNFERQYVYLLLDNKTSAKILQDYLDGISSAMYASNPVKVKFASQPLGNIAMGPDFRNPIGETWDIGGFIIFSVFALLILLPACFNYINISLARALRRAKEIGLRKTIGGHRNQIFAQFVTETLIITLLSLIMSLVIFVVIRDQFQSMLVAGASTDLSITWPMGFTFVLFGLATGLIAGIIPALYFARLNPVEALKSKIAGQGSSMRLRKSLTVLQFVLSFGFILSLLVFGRQYRYSLNFDFGFQKDNILTVELKDVSPGLIAQKFSQLASVKSMSMSSGLPGLGAQSVFISKTGTDSVEADQMFIDHNFIRNFKLQLIAGKDFPDENSAHEKFMMVNEEFLSIEGLKNPAEVLGRVYTINGNDLEVIGVVKDFHYAPLHDPIGKLCLRTNPDEYHYANLEVVSSDAQAMITEMENIWKTFPTATKFEARYFDQELNEAFSTYKVLLKMVGFLGLLAVTISLLGMLGMVVYTSETKTKEVSIRKVMGASVAGIAILLSKDYLRMMTIAIVISIPLTIILLEKLLPGLQYYHADIALSDVAISTIIFISLGVVTITSQTYRTARLNPAETLKSE